MQPMPSRNVLGGPLKPCSVDPVTGFFRNGRCDTCAEDTRASANIGAMALRTKARFPNGEALITYDDRLDPTGSALRATR